MKFYFPTVAIDSVNVDFRPFASKVQRANARILKRIKKSRRTKNEPRRSIRMQAPFVITTRKS